MSTTAPTRSGAENVLRLSNHPALRLLRVEETEAVIVISGKVQSYYFKQLAQETLMPVLGPRRLVNQVVVAS